MMPTTAPEITAVSSLDRVPVDAPSLVEVDATGARVLVTGAHALVAGDVLIGRSGGCDVTLRQDGQVSRRHCRLRRTPYGWRIEDLGSRHGVWVDGHRVEACDLGGGELVRIGQTFLRFER